MALATTRWLEACICPCTPLLLSVTEYNAPLRPARLPMPTVDVAAIVDDNDNDDDDDEDATDDDDGVDNLRRVASCTRTPRVSVNVDVDVVA